MPMDGVTLCLVAKELHARLAGGRIDKITQPERDEVILTIRAGGENHALLLCASAGCARAHITKVKKNNPLEPPNLCMLLRKHTIGGRIGEIRQAESDRILEIVIEHNDEMGDRTQKTLICEFMGKHSNIILVSADGKIMESARRVNESVSSFRQVLPGLFYRRPPAHGKLPFDALDKGALADALKARPGALAKALSASISGLSSPLARELSLRAAGDEDAFITEDRAEAIAGRVCAQMEDILAHPSPRVLLNEAGETCDLLAFPYQSREGQPMRAYPTLSEAIDDFYTLRDREERIKQKSGAMHRAIKTNMERLEKKISLQIEALESGARMEEYRVKGELLTASPQLVKKGMKLVRLPNYYEEDLREMDVELDEKLNAAANAQRYFKLYKKAQSARKLAEEQRSKSAEELAYLEGQMDNLDKCADESALWEMREELVRMGYIKDTATRRQQKALPPSEPMKFASPDGTAIWAGKNNVQNERLTFGAAPEEYWLHAKDIPGSHVIIKSDKPSPETLLLAAKLAARYSKSGASSNVPVDYTLRKYVKKPAGAKPGFVIYTHQRTLVVTPDPETRADGGR